MNKEFFEALELLEKEKGISAAYMMEKVEAALVSAYKRDNGGQDNVRVKLDPVKKEVRLYRRLSARGFRRRFPRVLALVFLSQTQEKAHKSP